MSHLGWIRGKLSLKHDGVDFSGVYVSPGCIWCIQTESVV